MDPTLAAVRGSLSDDAPAWLVDALTVASAPASAEDTLRRLLAAEQLLLSEIARRSASTRRSSRAVVSGEEDEPPWLTKAAAAVACLRQASANLRAKNARTRGSIGRAHSTLLEEGEDAASVCEHGVVVEPVLRSEPLLHASLLLRRLRIRLRISHTFWLPVCGILGWMWVGWFRGVAAGKNRR